MDRKCIIDMDDKLYFCVFCETNKPEASFYKCKSSKNGLQYRCKDCEKQYKLDNLEKVKQRRDRYYEATKEKQSIQKREYYIKNKERIDKRNKNWAENNKDKVKSQKHGYYLENKEKENKRTKEWRINNIEKSREYQNNWTKNKRATDPHYKMQHRLRNRILGALKEDGTRKSTSFKELTGCDLDFLKKHIENLFTEGMTWELLLKSEIHIDHIKPCCSFDLANPEEQRKCFHYTNLRPLWKKDNVIKAKEDKRLSIKVKN